jgi:dTMP kinase
MLVSFSGIDSSGKSTQISLLEKYLHEHGIRAKKIWGKARGTPGIVLLKSLLRRDWHFSDAEKLVYREKVLQSNAKKNLLLYISLVDLLWYFGIYYRIQNLIYKITILDRYIWDTYIEIKTEFPDVQFENWVLWKALVRFSPKPQISFLFLIPPEESIRRDVQKCDLTIDSLELKKQKINLYEKLSQNGKWSIMVNGMQPIDTIHASILKLLNTD